MQRLAHIPKHYCLIPLLFIGFLLSQIGSIHAFPSGAFSYWLVFVAIDAVLRLFPGNRFHRGRLVLWASAALYLCASAGAPLLGVFFVVFPAFLWIETKKQNHFFWIFALIFLLFRFLPFEFLKYVQWIGVFYFFRFLSWRRTVQSASLSFLESMEYFLSPVFWLYPCDSSFIHYKKFKEPMDPEWFHLKWIGTGLLLVGMHAVFLFFFKDWISRNYLVLSWDSVFLLPVVFLLFYLSAARGSYLVAGFMGFSGHHVAPDFSDFWKACTLKDFFSKFHFWVSDFFEVEILPFAKCLPVWVPKRIHYFFLHFAFLELVFCPFGNFGSITLFSFLFALLLSLSEWFRKWALLSRVVMILSLGFLSIAAYPIFYLGWSLANFWSFK